MHQGTKPPGSPIEPAHVHRRCYICRRWLPVAAFGTDRSRSDGRKYLCRPCEADSRRIYRARLRDRMGAVA